MSKSNYKPNYRAEINIRKTVAQIHQQNKTVSQDTQNRKYVIKKGVELIKNGMTEEQAIEEIMKDDVIKQFEYLSKVGIDIKNTVRQWIKREMETKSKDGEER